MPKRSAVHRIKYLGVLVEGTPTHFISGVPARDLLPEEWESLSQDLRASCLASGLYEVVGGEEPSKEGDA